MLVLVGLFLGLVFLLAGTSGALSRLREGLRSMRIRRRGMNIDAEILRSQPLTTGRSHEPAAVLISGQWEWGEELYKGEFTVPGRWWEERDGASIAVRVDPNRPHVAEVAGESPSHVWAIALAVGWLIMAIVGAVFLFRSAAYACDPVQFDFLEPMCQSVRGVVG